MRGIKSVEKLKESNWFKFYKEHKNELFLGIRDNYVNIYYKCASLARISGNFSDNAYIARKYININDEGNEIKIDYNDFQENYEKIKSNVNEHIKQNSGMEKEVQQELTLRNNFNNNSNWICVDIEYVKKGNNKDGRYDILAVSKEKPYRVAIIELKVGDGAIAGDSGILKHASDWHKFIEKSYFNKDKEESLVLEIINILNNNYELEINGIKQLYKPEDFVQNPEFYFIICSGDKTTQDIKTKVGQYLWNKTTAIEHGITERISTKNIQDSLKYDISKKGDGKLYCKFLFAKGNGKLIYDIIDDKNYEKFN